METREAREASGEDNDGIQRLGWALLSEWWCVPVGANEEKVLEKIAKVSQIGLVVKGDLSLIKDRLYGGFKCEEENKRHVFFATGNYTYLGENSEAEPSHRQEDWKKLLTAGNGFVGGGLFTEDVPADAMLAERSQPGGGK